MQSSPPGKPARPVANRRLSGWRQFCLRPTDMTLSCRLLLCFALTLAIFTVACVSVIRVMATQSESQARFFEEIQALGRTVAAFSEELGRSQRVLVDYSGNRGTAPAGGVLNYDLTALTDRGEKLQSTFAAVSHQRLRTWLVDQQLPELQRQLQGYTKLYVQIITALRADQDISPQIVQSTYRFALPLNQQIQAIQTHIVSVGMSDGKTGADLLQYIQYQLATALGVAVAAVSLLIFMLQRSMKRGLQRIRKSIERLTAGNLIRGKHAHGRNEFGDIEQRLDELAAVMDMMLGRHRNDAEQLQRIVDDNVSALEEISASFAGQQNSGQTVITATSSLEASIGKVTEFARSTLKEVKVAEDASDTCRRTMQDNITTTHQLSDRLRATSGSISSVSAMGDQIKEIVSTIDGIADQVNLLALNATIEAARSGIYGRGFAVVADEIRNLSIKTAKSTKEVAATVTQLSTAVAQSVKVVASCESEMNNSVQQSSRANSSIEEIMGIIATISDMSEQIVESCQEQSARTSEVNLSLEDITKTSSGTYEQLTSVKNQIRQVRQLAASQTAALERFKLTPTDVRTMTLPVAAASALNSSAPPEIKAHQLPA